MFITVHDSGPLSVGAHVCLVSEMHSLTTGLQHLGCEDMVILENSGSLERSANMVDACTLRMIL